MINRKVVFSLVAFTVFFLFYLFIATPKVSAQACCGDWDCPAPAPCWRSSNWCNGSAVVNYEYCYSETCDGASCPDYTGYCNEHISSVTLDHSYPCACGCSGDACAICPPPPPQVCSPYSQGSVCNTGSCSDGSVCAQGHQYCLWDGSGWGSCSEEVNNCASQCTSPPPPASCGDGVCNIGEDCSNCSTDCSSCGTSPYCGDGSCNNGETCSSCSGDCGACTGVSCNTDVSLSAAPNPANFNSGITFSISGDASTFLGDTWTGGVTGCGGAWNSINCTTNQAGSFQWSHTWKHCEGSFDNCSSTCSKTIPFTVNTPIPAVPTNLSASCPAPGTTASLSWNSVAGATYYDVWYDASFKYNIIGTSTTIAGFNPGSGHTWGVRACNSSGCSGWSSTGSFTCVLPQPPTPTITTPACIFSGYNGSGVTISWAATSPVVTYVDISTASDFSSYYNKAVTTTSTTAAGFSGGLTLNPATPYYVRTWNGFLHSNTATFSIPLCVPAAPTTLNASCPVPGTTGSLSWNSVAGATYYALRVNNLTDGWDGSCSSPGGDFCSNETGISRTFNSIPGTSYSWWVHACNNAGCSSPTYGTSFTCVLPPCPGGPAPAPTGLGACGSGSGPVSSCIGGWQPDPGPSNAYNIWCNNTTGSNRPFCYTCGSSAWIQSTGDVHSNKGINAPGGP